MNRFQYLSAPCLVCKKEVPGIAYGIRPNMAVCADDWVGKRKESETALIKAELAETEARQTVKNGGT